MFNTWPNVRLNGRSFLRPAHDAVIGSHVHVRCAPREAAEVGHADGEMLLELDGNEVLGPIMPTAGTNACLPHAQAHA